MKKIILTTCCIVQSILGLSQNIDSFLSAPQTFELSISTPQPRLKEKFKISLDIEYIRAHIFKSIIGKIKLADEIGNSDAELMILNVHALKKGKNEIGPLNFTLNGTKYSTNKIEYEVIDALPNTDKGLWIRKVITSDSTFCIIIEQRIPAYDRTTIISDKETKYWTEPQSEDFVKIKFPNSLEGIKGPNSTAYSEFGSIRDESGLQKQFMFGYSIYYYRIIDKSKKIVFSEDVFENLPKDITFKDIIVQ